MTKSCFSAKDWHILCRHMQKQIFPAQVLPAPCSATLARFDLANCSDHRARCAVLSMGELSPEWWQQLPYHRELGIILFTVLPVWACGAVIGLLMPRPKWLEAGASAQVFFSSPVGLCLRRLTLLYQAAYLLRTIWSYFNLSQSFGATHDVKQGAASGPVKHRSHRRRRHHQTDPHTASEADEGDAQDQALSNWYVQEADLEFFKDRVERDSPAPGCDKWELVMAKDFGGVAYTAYKRHLADGKTDYKSVTVAEDATAQEFMDFYLDDDIRAKWDPMISHHEVIEAGPPQHRCQVVRWVRSFPFSFIKEREYYIARRAWAQQGCLYGITKAIDHPCAVRQSNIVRMDMFYSMWRSRTIPCPKGTDRPACETVLLHREDFKIPEKMARFAVRHGMAGFVKKMGAGVHPFVEARRARVAKFEEDPDAFGMKLPQNPPSQAMQPSASAQSLGSAFSMASDGGLSELDSPRSSAAGSDWPETPVRKPHRRFRLVRQFGCALVATWAAVVIRNTR